MEKESEEKCEKFIEAYKAEKKLNEELFNLNEELIELCKDYDKTSDDLLKSTFKHALINMIVLLIVLLLNEIYPNPFTKYVGIGIVSGLVIIYSYILYTIKSKLKKMED